MDKTMYILSKLLIPVLAVAIFVSIPMPTFANPIAWPGYHLELRKEKLKFELDHTVADVEGEYYFSSENHLKSKSSNKTIFLLLPIYVDKNKERRIDNEIKVLLNNKNIIATPIDGKDFVHKLDSITPYYSDIQWYQIPLGNVSSLNKNEIGPIYINYKQKVFKYGRYKYFIYTPLFSDYFIKNDKTAYYSDLEEFIVTINNNFRNSIELNMGTNKFRNFNTITFSLQHLLSRDIEPIVVKIRELNGYKGP